jgi:hypothetical protein
MLLGRKEYTRASRTHKGDGDSLNYPHRGKNSTYAPYEILIHLHMNDPTKETICGVTNVCEASNKVEDNWIETVFGVLGYGS